VGPLHLGLPFVGHRHDFQHRLAPRAIGQTKGLHDEADLNAPESMPGLPSPLLYPVLASPAVFDDVFWPSSTSWPFSYDAIFQTAFAKASGNQTANLCQQPDRTNAIVGHITNEIKPTASQLQQLQILGGALGQAGVYLAKTCPENLPAQPVARLQLMEWQIEKLSMALSMIRQPLLDFEQSLTDAQRTRFAKARETRPAAGRRDGSENIAAACAAGPNATDWPIQQISLTVDPTDDQRNALENMKTAFVGAAKELSAYCGTQAPRDPLARLDATETRLDGTWRTVVAIEVALANFEKTLTDEQRGRLAKTDLTAAR